MGVNSLKMMMPRVSEFAGLCNRYTNHTLKSNSSHMGEQGKNAGLAILNQEQPDWDKGKNLPTVSGNLSTININL